MKYRIATRISAIRQDNPIIRSWKNKDGKAEFEYGATEYVVVTEPPLNLSITSQYKPEFEVGAKAVLTLEVDDVPATTPGERVPATPGGDNASVKLVADEVPSN